MSSALLGSIIGGFAAVAAMLFWFGWGIRNSGQSAHLDPTRADYVDLLLTVVTIFLGAVGLAVTVGALVIGLVAFKTLREIKTEAASEAKTAAAVKISETISAELQPKVDAAVREVLPSALQKALMDDDLANKILTKIAGLGGLDAVVERVVVRLQGGPVDDPEQPGDDSGDLN